MSPAGSHLKNRDETLPTDDKRAGDEPTEPRRWPVRLDEPEIPPGQPFLNDKLDRERYADFLTQLVLRSNTPLVLGLDSDWGTGKTTFAKMWRQKLEVDGCETLYFNAWETDYVAEPLVALVGELDIARRGRAEDQFEKVKCLAAEVLRKALPIAARLLTAGLLDVKTEEIKEALEQLSEEAAEETIEAYRTQKDELKKFREALIELLKEIRGDKPLVFFIDELDRCRPTFAVELLERIKHLFEVEGIVFVLVMHREQLAHSVRGLYGGQFDASAYLRRFLDLSYSLPVPQPGRFGRFLVERFDLPNTGFREPDPLIFLMEFLGFSLRHQERCVVRAALAGRTLHGGTWQRHPLLPVLAALAEWNPQRFRAFADREVHGDEILADFEKRDPEAWRSSSDSAWIEAAILLFEALRRGDNRRHGSTNPTARYRAYEAAKESDPEWAGQIVDAYQRIGETQAFEGGLRVMEGLLEAVNLTRGFRNDVLQL